jgi:CheY-like chemotaxis protein
VGLDVVRDEIQQLKGTIEILSELGKGTRFVIRLPLTLSITETLLMACGDDRFAVPIDTIVETTRIALDEIETVEAKEVMSLRGEIIPLIRIHQMFSLPRRGIVEKRFFPVVIVQSADRRLGLLVDEIIGHQDTVIKALGDPLKDTLNIAGGTVSGDGRVILILDVPSIIYSAASGGRRSMVQVGKTTGDTVASGERRILLAEDTPSTAMLERSVLEAAGFTVDHGRDGKEALEMALQKDYDLVISDVLMPRMNGFELTANLKGSPRTRQVPVVIVTTRGSDADKKRGLDAGADAYVLKKDFTSDSFLETIDRLLA